MVLDHQNLHNHLVVSIKDSVFRGTFFGLALLLTQLEKAITSPIEFTIKLF
jgi:hypothetical protein